MAATQLVLPEAIARLRGGLIVSCQVLPHEPLHGSAIMARMALAARKEPDLALVAELAPRRTVPVVVEGGISTPAQARAALNAGAFAVVVGAAITRPQWITAQFVARIQDGRRTAG
jgi:putative N-acetylmannosamine-6-phosphate epimerase